MADSRTGLKLIESSTEHDFPIAIDQNGAQLIQIESVSWEPGDSKQDFRVPLHPCDQGLSANRIDYDISFNGNLVQRPSRTYAKANADLSWPGILVPPPLLETIALAGQVSSFAFTGAELSYTGTPGGTTGSTNKTYAGTPTGTPLSVAGPPYYVGLAGGQPTFRFRNRLGTREYISGGRSEEHT